LIAQLRIYCSIRGCHSRSKSGPQFSPAATNTLSSHRTSDGPQMWPSETLPPGKLDLDVNAGLAAFPGMNVLEPSIVSNKGLASTRTL